MPFKFALHMSPHHNISTNTWENLLQSTTRGKHLSFSAIENSVSNSKNKHIPSGKIYKKPQTAKFMFAYVSQTHQKKILPFQ
jgi:hypothetical protein